MTPTEKAKITREMNRQRRKERQERWQAEREKQLYALRLVRDDPRTAPADRLRAAELIHEIDG